MSTLITTSLIKRPHVDFLCLMPHYFACQWGYPWREGGLKARLSVYFLHLTKSFAQAPSKGVFLEILILVASVSKVITRDILTQTIQMVHLCGLLSVLTIGGQHLSWEKGSFMHLCQGDQSLIYQDLCKIMLCAIRWLIKIWISANPRCSKDKDILEIFIFNGIWTIMSWLNRFYSD